MQSNQIIQFPIALISMIINTQILYYIKYIFSFFRFSISSIFSYIFVYFIFFLNSFRSKTFSLWMTKTQCSIQYLKHEGRANEPCIRDTNHTATHSYVYICIIHIRNGKHHVIYTTFVRKHFYYLPVFVIVCMYGVAFRSIYRETRSEHGHRGIPCGSSVFFLYTNLISREIDNSRLKIQNLFEEIRLYKTKAILQVPWPKLVGSLHDECTICV